MPLILGVMGWFASGKSAACKYLSEKGFFEIDVDLIGKDALRSCKDQVLEEFGEAIIENGLISPKKLGSIVFENENEMKKLNAIVHPWIKSEVKHIIDKNPDEDILINAAILPQLKLQNLCDKILMIDASQDILLKRGQSRNQFPPEKVLSILEMQKKSNEYFQTADYVINNNGQLKDFFQKLEKFLKKIKGESHDLTGRQL